jgi:hypothetical protein
MPVLVAVRVHDLDRIDPRVHVAHHQLVSAFGGVQDDARAFATGDHPVRTGRVPLDLDDVVVQEFAPLAAQCGVEDRRDEQQALVGQ